VQVPGLRQAEHQQADSQEDRHPGNLLRRQRTDALQNQSPAVSLPASFEACSGVNL